PLAEATHASLGHGPRSGVPWAVEQTPLPISGSDRGVPGIATDGSIGVDDMIDYARAAGFAKFRVHFPRAEHGVGTVASTTVGAATRRLAGARLLLLDAATGIVLAAIRLADCSPMGKLMAAGIPLRPAVTSPVSLVVNVLFCLAVIGMAGAAVAAWWAR